MIFCIIDILVQVVSFMELHDRDCDAKQNGPREAADFHLEHICWQRVKTKKVVVAWYLSFPPHVLFTSSASLLLLHLFILLPALVQILVISSALLSIPVSPQSCSI